jgi:hypothetical protein
MRSNDLTAILKAAAFAVTVLLLTAGGLVAQTVNLTALQQTMLLPDGNTVPMWGWNCGAAVAGSTATCSALTYNTTTAVHNPQVGGAIWQPPLIVVPYVGAATSLTINLTNSLPVETSIVIVGQVAPGTTANNGGIGLPVREAGPRTDGAHAGQTATTWTTVIPGSFTPPTQGERARSWAPEVAGVATVGATPAVGTYTWTSLKPGTYLMRTATYPSIQGPMGLYGVLVVTEAPSGTSPGTAYPAASAAAGAVTYDADVVALESEIDPRQNNMVAALFPTGGATGSATANAGFSETAKWTPQCGAGANGLTSNGTAATCYPPAVDYTPLYFLTNGLAFSKDNRQASALPVPAAGPTGNVLVRFVNAGSHMHVPTVNGLDMLLVAEDGYVLPDIALALGQSKVLTAKTTTTPSGLRLQDEVFLAAGKVFDVIVSPTQTTAGTYDSNTYATYDRSLALGTGGVSNNGGMQAFLDVNDPGAAKLAAANSTAVANPDTYAYAPGVTLAVSDPNKGVTANDINVYGVQVLTPPTSGTLTLYPNGTFTYTPTGSGTDHFTYCANGSVTAGTCSSGVTATVTLNLSGTVGHGPTANPDSYTSTVSSLIRVGAPGVLDNDVDPNGYSMTAALVTKAQAFLTVYLNPDGSFTVTKPAVSSCPAAGCTFTYQAKNAQGSLSNTTTVTLNFLPATNLSVRVQDAQTKAAITDYKWIIEQDLTFQIDPACQQNGPGGTKPTTCPSGVPPTLGTNFHTSYMPVIAEGCTGPISCEQGQTVYDGNPSSPTYQQHVQAACDGYGICNTSLRELPTSLPSQANLPATDQFGRPAAYYISILPGDAQNAWSYANSKDPSVAGNCTPGANGNPSSEPTGITESSACGHTMSGAPIPAAVAGTFAPVIVNLEPEPLKTATVTAWVFEDDYPLNGEPDSGGGVDVLATQEPGLGDFQIEIWDTAGGIGDNTGQMTYDMFNMPLTNALNGTIDPNSGLDACPLSNTSGVAAGTIVVCPQYESDGVTLSPLTGQVVVRNLMQGKFSLIAHPGATREARGEEWFQTNSLDGTPFLDSFIKSGEPAYFQEYGPGGYHVFFAEANPAIINARLAAICNGTNTDTTILYGPPCRNTVNGQVTNLHQGRSPSENLYGSGVFAQGDGRNYAMLAYTNCIAAIGDTDGATIGLARCDANGNFTFTGLPDGNYGVVIFDQWDDFILDGSSRPVNVSGGQTLNLEFPTFTWQTHIWSNTYMDTNGNGVQDPGEPGLIQVPTRIRQTNGKLLNTLLSDASGMAHFDETFPAFAWYNVESDTTRFRATGVHAVNDAGGQPDGPIPSGNGNTAYPGILNSTESFPLPANLRVPGAYYCTSGNCAERQGIAGPAPAGGTGGSTGRIDPGTVEVEGWQGGVSEFDLLDWGKIPYAPGENGGIRGHVVNATTRPFDDPRMLFQNLWEPLVPNVTIKLYSEGTAPDGTTSLTLVDTTQTTSWDAWVQGVNATTGLPNMSCPGQDPVNDPFFIYTLAATPNYLAPTSVLPYNSQYKCYDGYHNLNQLQPAPYDGLYEFPSRTCLTAGATFTVPGNPTVYHCATIANPAAGQPGAKPAILPLGKYVAEVVLPPGWELNKEEDLNLLIGDQYIAPVSQQFVGNTAIFIVPDQATLTDGNPSYTGPYTPSNPYSQPFAGSASAYTPSLTNNGSPSTDWGRTTFGDFGPGGLIVQSAPCVGLMRIVPDYLSIAPESGEVAPFAGSTRPLCDRKEVTLDDQMQANAEFFIFTKTPKTTNFTGFITDDFASEFDPASPTFGEKFAIPNVPISIKDFNGVEVSRVYSDQYGNFNGLVYSTWEVDPPNITGYSPNVMITCMNDPGPIAGPNGTMITDPSYNPAYSIFCYENPFMPGDTQYLDTPVVPVSAFADGFNPPDCAYPDATPAIASVTGDTSGGGAGPWVSAAGHTLTIISLAPSNTAGIPVLNNAYSGPAATNAPYNLKTIPRHYGFGTQCTSPSASSTTCNTLSSVTIGGVKATVSSWSDAQIKVTVPTGVPACTIQQRGVSATARCGELVITAGNGKQSIDTVTVTIGGKAPGYIAGENAANNALQKALDAATPGDLIIVGPGIYNEMLLMWKPVRLQGVGAASVTVNANVSPNGKLLEPWRRQVNCLFGLALNGGVISSTNPYDPNPSNPFVCSPTMQQQVDRVTGEGVVGWQADLNGNLAELLQEPSLMGAYEGAAITVLAKGVRIPAGTDAFGTGTEGFFPAGTVVLTNSTADCTDFPGNFLCNPSRIDGMSFTNSSQGGGGIWLHGWNHYTEVSNNRVFNNGGTLSGGITVGYPEVPDAETGRVDGTSLIDANGMEQPYLLNQYVQVHNNSVTLNASYGDELGSNTPASAGGVTFCTGADYYKFQYNWVCGNLSSGNGGGFAHFGFSWNGDIEHNSFIFNQSINPTLTTYGGGVIIEGMFPDGFANVGGVQTECGSTNDIDCAPGLSDGSGPGIVVNANLFQGNTAEEGSGGGLELQHVNGTDVQRNPTNPGQWYQVTVTNNIFANNVAGWDGGGVSLHDAVNVNFINNTVVSNDSTATAGILFDTIGAANASQPPPGCDPTITPLPPACTNTSVTTSNFEPAGLATEVHTAAFLAAFTNPSVTCPAGHDTNPPTHACVKFSIPLVGNDLFWQNRAFHITTPTVSGVAPSSSGPVQLVPALSQTTTGTCPGGATYWDIGVYSDTAPTNHASGLTLNPQYSMFSSGQGYTSNGNISPSSAGVVSQYCNGSRVPPEIAPQLCTVPNGNANAPGCIQPGTVGLGMTAPGGVPDSVPPPLPAFTLTPAATVDEGSNWINMFYGPLSLTNPTILSGSTGYGLPLGNYALAAGSAAIDVVPTSSPTYVLAPSTDFFGHPRPDTRGSKIDIGAVEAQAPLSDFDAAVSISAPSPALTSTPANMSVKNGTITVTNTGTGPLALMTAPTITKTAGAAASTFTITGGTCKAGTILQPGGACTITVQYAPAGTTKATAYVTLTDIGAATATQNSAALSGN